MPDPHAPDRNGYAALRSHVTADAYTLEVQDPGLDSNNRNNSGFHRVEIPGHLLVRYQHVRLLRNLVSAFKYMKDNTVCLNV